MHIDREEHWSGKVYRSIGPARSQPGRYVRHVIGQRHWHARLDRIRAHLDIVGVLARIRDKRATEEG